MLLGKVKLSRRGKLDWRRFWGISRNQPRHHQQTLAEILKSGNLAGEYEKCVRSWLALDGVKQRTSSAQRVSLCTTAAHMRHVRVPRLNSVNAHPFCDELA